MSKDLFDLDGKIALVTGSARLGSAMFWPGDSPKRVRR